MSPEEAAKCLRSDSCDQIMKEQALDMAIEALLRVKECDGTNETGGDCILTCDVLDDVQEMGEKLMAHYVIQEHLNDMSINTLMQGFNKWKESI